MALGRGQVLDRTRQGWRYHAPADMDAEQLASWTALIESRVGICLPAIRKSFLLVALADRARAVGLDDYSEYFAYLQDGGRGAVEWEALVDRLTIHETRFYRDPAAVDFIGGYVRERAGNGVGPLRLDVWSAGCATGEEAYTLAMVCDRALAKGDRPYYFGVTATDVSRRSLAHGRGGVYHRSKLGGVPAEGLRRAFLPVDLDRYRVVERLRERVCFTRLNLQELETAPIGEMDVIMCQNVLIYFKPEVRRAIVSRMVRHLRPGGVLVLGAGELVGWMPPGLLPAGTSSVSAWRRPDGAEGSR